MMDDRIIKYYQNQLTDEECKSLLEDCQTDTELKRQMIEYRNVMAMVSLHPSLENKAEGYKHWSNFISHISSSHTGINKKPAHKWLRYAAIFAVLFTGIGSVYQLFFHHHPTPIAMCTLTAANGKMDSTVLSDGTKVWLNAGSTLSYPQTLGQPREVTLDGEGYFEVAKHKGQFIVHSAPINVTVLGTHFTITNYRHSTPSVSLLEGAVHVSAKGMSPVTLRPNEKATLKGNRLTIQQMDEDPTLWIQGIFVFDNQSLYTILEQLSVNYSTPIDIRNTALKNERFTGKLRKADGLDECLKLLQHIADFNIQIQRDKNNQKIYIIN